MTAEEWPLFRYMDELAFGYTWPGTDDDPALGVMEHERSIIARHDGEPAGIASAFSFHMTVPGGSTLPTAGVTWVGVLPTHRRRGVLTELMKHQLMSIAQASKEPLAALWASEPGIYGRFGYGLASRKLDLNV